MGNSQTIESIESQFRDMLKDAYDETKVDLERSREEIAAYMRARTEALSRAVGEPGFAKAVRAARNNTALFAGLQVDDAVEPLKDRIIGLIGGALRLAAVALA